MQTAAIYARYSSDSQTEQSIEGQLRVCEEYAKRNNIVILNTYIDRAMTGTNDHRPEFQHMIKDSAKREWNYVLVYKLDRFSRNKYEMAMHKKTLKDNGIKVVSATEYIPDSPEGIIFESMLEGYAEFYSAELSQKIRRGNNESRHKGNLTGGRTPFGYKRIEKKAIIDDERADVVRYIFEQYAAGIFVKDIIAELQKRGITYYGKKFVPQTVYKILANERYSGVYHYNGEAFYNIYPRIVPQDIFDRVRLKVNANHYGKKSVDIVYLLKGKLKCGYCGESLNGEYGTSRNGEKVYYYKCNGRKHKSGCTKAPIRKDLLERLILENIYEALNNEAVIKDIIQGLMQVQERQAKCNTVLSLLLKEKRQTDTAIDNIMTAIEKGVVTSTTTKRLKSYEEKQEELERQILIEKSKTIAKFSENDLKQYFAEGLRLENQLLIDYFVKEIIVYDDKIKIIYNNLLPFSPDQNNGQGFFYTKRIKITLKDPHRINLVKLEFVLTMQI